MKQILSFLLVCAFVQVTAQPTYDQRIQDTVLYWEKVYNFKGKQYAPRTYEGLTYSAKRIAMRDSFYVWFQRTYTPIAGIGTTYDDDKNTFVSQRFGAKPQGLGADFSIWNVSFENGGRVLKKIPETWTPVWIYINHLQGVNQVELFKGMSTFFFTMPRRNYGSTFTDAGFIDLVKEYGLHDGDRFSKYMVYFTGRYVTVVLTPGNKLPIKQLTKGEYLEQLEKGLANATIERKKDLGRNIDQAWFDKEVASTQKKLKEVKEKYKNRLNEPAMLKSQYGPGFGEFYNMPNNPAEVFHEDNPRYTEGFPVYRFEDWAIEESKKDKPLWISITWAPARPVANPKNTELHRAMLKYFNYEYVYDFFFNPEKVKGQPYTVSNAADQAARLRQRKNYWNEPSKPQLLPAGVHFADDFSNNADNAKPAGWFSRGVREEAFVTPVKDMPGKWVRLGHMNEFYPSTSLKKPLPGNFSMEFDVATDEFPGKTGGQVSLYLGSFPVGADGKEKAGDGASLRLTLTAGNEADYNNNNYSGKAEIKIYSTPELNKDHYGTGIDYIRVLREFTDKKRKIQVKLQVKNKEVLVFINGKEVMASRHFKLAYGGPCTSCGLPLNTAFKTLIFENQTHDWYIGGKPNDTGVYITNVKITKL